MLVVTIHLAMRELPLRSSSLLVSFSMKSSLLVPSGYCGHQGLVAESLEGGTSFHCACVSAASAVKAAAVERGVIDGRGVGEGGGRKVEEG